MLINYPKKKKEVLDAHLFFLIPSKFCFESTPSEQFVSQLWHNFEVCLNPKCNCSLIVIIICIFLMWDAKHYFFFLFILFMGKNEMPNRMI
jgi:hypothetical protein